MHEIPRAQNLFIIKIDLIKIDLIKTNLILKRI